MGVVRVATIEHERRLVVLEFDSMEQAKAWRASPEYAAAKQVRETCARSNMIVAEGV